jgi:uncharacterized protein (DUF1684 family)
MEAALKRNGVAALAALALALFTICWNRSSIAQPAPTADSASWQQNLSSWRTQHEHEIDSPGGWLTLAGLEWLKPGVNSVGMAADNKIRIHADAPEHIGLITVIGNVVQFLAPSGGFPAGLQINGSPAREGTLDVSDDHPSNIIWHGLSLVVLSRGGRFALRIKDNDSPTRTAFRGLHWFSPDPRYRVIARWIPYHPPQVEQIPTALGTSLNMTAPGVAEFLLDGKVYLLEPVIEGGDTSHLLFILGDETNSTATYSGGRFLHTGLPDHGLTQPGNLSLDFNRLYNPPCAYTTFASCPMPPQKNRLSVAIEAGEQRFIP